MAEQIKSWNGKNILKIKSDPLREVEFKKDAPEDTDHNSPESLRKEIEPWLTALCYRKLDNNRKHCQRYWWLWRHLFLLCVN